jgi:dolichol-phosphate mannosyltransferase
MQIAIVIPTYNERANIVTLIPQIRQATKDIVYSTFGGDPTISKTESTAATIRNCIHIIIVDDNSSDGTADAVLTVSEKDNNIHLIKRPGKMGLGSAYKDAFKWINNNLDAEIVVQMDADLSHPPHLLRKMTELVAAGSADAVIASRYLDKGGTQNWPVHRRLISKGANWLAKSVLGIKVNDITSGYRAYNVSSVRDFLSNNLSSSGYEYQIEVLYILSRLDKKIVEIPFTFANRTEGRSKLGVKDIMHFASTVFKLKFRKVENKEKQKNNNNINNKRSASDELV